MKFLEKLKNLLPHKEKSLIENVKEQKYWIITAIIITLIILSYPKQKFKNDNKIPVQISGRTVRVEVAKTSSQKSKGLMYRKELPQNEGMLFPFSYEGPHSFWMKNTLIPLDIVWLNSQKEVVHIEHSVPPCKKAPCPGYSSPYKARYVIELNGGWSIENGLKLGDRLSFSY